MPRTRSEPKHRTAAPAANGLTFEDHLRLSLQSIRAALAEVAATVNADATKPQNLARHLGLDKSLAWHLSKILTEEDVLATVSHLPGKAGARIALRAFEVAGAPDSAIDALRAALDDFDLVVATHCGDRETLEMMLGHVQNGETQAAREEAQRRKLFQGASAIWGVQARVHVAAHFVAPAGDDKDMLDLGIMCGLVDLRRLRADVPWAVASVRQFTGDGTPQSPEVWEPVDERVAQNDVPLMRDFCSHPLPPLRTAPGLPGITRYEIVEGPVGNTAAMTCMAGWISRRCVSRFRTDTDRFGEHLVNITTPAELLVYDLFIHRDCGFGGAGGEAAGGTGRLPPEFNLYSQLPGGPTYPQSGRERGRLPLRESLLDLGASPPDVIVPEVPRYRQMVDKVFARLGSSAADFQGYRLKMRYPPIPTLGVFRYQLAERTTTQR